MTALRFPLLLLALTAAVLAAPQSALANAGHPRDEAAAYYDSGDYATAYKRYLKLAKSGDAFAQYRVSYMTLVGRGTRSDVVEAMAWAVVASEHDHEQLDTYRGAVAALVPADKRKKAQSRADYFVRRYGKDDRNSGSSRSAGGTCTGSRIARNCDESGSGGAAWIAWGEDRSEDPAQRTRIEELNRAIVDAADPGAGAAGT